MGPTFCALRRFSLKSLLLAACPLVFLGAQSPDADVDITEFYIRDPRLHASHIFSDPNVVALAVAAEHGDVEKIDALMGQRVDVNARSKQSITPLTWALITKNKAGFERLLQKGADPNHFVWNQVPLIHLAAEQEDPDWLRLCLKYRGDPNVVDRLDEDQPDSHQTTIYRALDSASFEQKLGPLIDAGANLNHQDRRGRTPLLHAAYVCGLSRAYLLLETGADFRIPADGGRDLPFSMIWVLPNIGVTLDREWEYRDKILDFLVAHGADFAPAEADIAKNLPKIVPLWEQDKKRRAARTKETAAAKPAPAPPAPVAGDQSAASAGDWILPDAIGTVIILQPRPSPGRQANDPLGRSPLQTFIDALTPPSEVRNTSNAPPATQGNSVGCRKAWRRPGRCYVRLGCRAQRLRAHFRIRQSHSR